MISYNLYVSPSNGLICWTYHSAICLIDKAQLSKQSCKGWRRGPKADEDHRVITQTKWTERQTVAETDAYEDSGNIFPYAKY